MHELDDEHIHLEGEEGEVVYVGDRVELLSVGVDIGSSTSHLIFSRLTLERQGARLSSRYVATRREVQYRSPIILTPYAPSGLIDAAALGDFIERSYGEAGMGRDQVDAGALITTGEAARRENARSIADLFAREAGKFVVATAGPNLESLLAAHGSGAVELSRALEASLLNIDIGGGTTKFATCAQGEVRETAAIDLGARLVAWDSDGRLTRLDGAARTLTVAAGPPAIALGDTPGADDLDRLAGHMAEVILEIAQGHRGTDLWITAPLRGSVPFRRLVISGGVGEYVYGRETREFGDLGPRLAAALRRRAADLDLELLEPREAIRATCIGASQYTVQLSGDTIFLSDEAILPVRSLPVVSVRGLAPSAPAIAERVRGALARMDLGRASGEDGRFALGVEWRHGADYASLRELCLGIVSALPGVKDGRPLTVVLDADIAGLMGALLQKEFGLSGAIVCLDQVALREFDYIDIGRPLPDQGVVPVVVKSLIFR